MLAELFSKQQVIAFSLVVPFSSLNQVQESSPVTLEVPGLNPAVPFSSLNQVQGLSQWHSWMIGTCHLGGPRFESRCTLLLTKSSPRAFTVAQLNDWHLSPWRSQVWIPLGPVPRVTERVNLFNITLYVLPSKPRDIHRSQFGQNLAC
jgi:hypothetical protein